MAPCRVPGPEWVRGASIREAVVEAMVARGHVIQGGTDQMHKNFDSQQGYQFNLESVQVDVPRFE